MIEIGVKYCGGTFYIFLEEKRKFNFKKGIGCRIPLKKKSPLGLTPFIEKIDELFPKVHSTDPD